MGVFRKLTSVSTLGLVDFKSDKERIANSTRKGMKAQKAMLAEMRKANAANGIAPTPMSRVGFVADAQARQVVADAQVTAASSSQFPQWDAVPVPGKVEAAPAPEAIAAPAPIAAPILSPDGHFWWDGSGWQPMPERPQG